MNSEELETSLREEFESYLKGVLAEFRQESVDFQSKLEAEFDRTKAHFEEAFKGFIEKFESERTFDAAFSGSVAEHLRLARDEGARITANAMAEAEKLGLAEPLPVVEVKYDAIRDAISDICGKDSQSAILKSLVHHAAEFAPRGAFFIIKSEHFAGWKVFGTEDEYAENAIREVHFPVLADTILGSAIAAGTTVAGSSDSHTKDSDFLAPLNFGNPDQMLAIPLVARGRGVAVLYADHGTSGEGVPNREVLESLVKVAGLTVELLASTQTAKAGNHSVAAADFENAPGYDDALVEAVSESEEPYLGDFGDSLSTGFEAEPESPLHTPPVELESGGFSFGESVAFESDFAVSEVDSDSPFTTVNPFEAEASVFEEPNLKANADSMPQAEETKYSPSPFSETPFSDHQEQTFGESPFLDRSEQSFDTIGAFDSSLENHEPVESEADNELTDGEIVFDGGGSIETAHVIGSPFEEEANKYEPAGAVTGNKIHQATEFEIEAPIAPTQPTRRSDRQVDLPIEVPEDERRIHNDARRFARLLVSEIKLYNEKKVIEGREAKDLYERLREAIDRSREMYDKRVQPPVASKFDYFHYEIVSSLAEGNMEYLGSGYPGSRV